MAKSHSLGWALGQWLYTTTWINCVIDIPLYICSLSSYTPHLGNVIQYTRYAAVSLSISSSEIFVIILIVCCRVV